MNFDLTTGYLFKAGSIFALLRRLTLVCRLARRAGGLSLTGEPCNV